MALHDELSTLFADGFANAVVDADSPAMQMIEPTCAARTSRTTCRPRAARAAAARLPRRVQAAGRVAATSTSAIQRPNAELVTARIERIEPDGVRTADGVLHELDVLVLATGFQVDAFLRPIDGDRARDGCALDEVWAKRPIAYLSISIPDFPNFFMLNGPNGPVGNFSLIEVAEIQFAYIMQLVERLRAGRVPRDQRDACGDRGAIEAERVEAAQHTIWATGCRSWYLDDRGIPAAWPWTFDRFREEMAAPKLDAFDFVS